ncbi:type II toxin-antitoxin system PemK/MazF family toxin [Enterococcus sp. AZ154]|uniref:type II toxin-antitoxin system PemK/MazF family toxin n=1 Tax=Enterococcus sp. AZ154 TaxID=2774683 RepID=UPI003D285B8B
MNNNDFNEINEFLTWTSKKIKLHNQRTSAQNRTLYRGQVYECELGVGIGSEQRKKRPVVIIQNNGRNNTSPNTIVVPITHTSNNLPIANKYDNSGNLILDGYCMYSNIVTVSKARLGNKICKLTNSEMKKLEEEIIKSQGMIQKFHALKNVIDDKDKHIKLLKENVAKKDEEIIRLKQEVTALKSMSTT